MSLIKVGWSGTRPLMMWKLILTPIWNGTIIPNNPCSKTSPHNKLFGEVTSLYSDV